MSQQEPVLTVSQLNQQVHYLLEESFPYVYVKGEISNFTCPTSGHWYFSLKDANAQVRCAMFKSKNRSCRFDMGNGVQVLATARVSLYEARGDYQLIVDVMEEFGQGALQQAFDKLKAKLDKEGLFAEQNKKPIPKIPKQIAVITSATGAALQDILRVLKRRMPSIPIMLYPSLVQGEQAAEQLVNALEIANQQANSDVIILARGGGSLEDLWPFNEEIVARAIAASQIPVVTGVGHQIDYTIADFVADLRAATPSAAAEQVSPDRVELLQQVADLQRRLFNQLEKQQQQLQQQLDYLSTRLQQSHPSKQLSQQQQRLGLLSKQLKQQQQLCLQNSTQRFDLLQARLQQFKPEQRITEYQTQLKHLQKQLQQLTTKQLENKQQQLQQLASTLHTASPLATLARGYAIVSDSTSKKVLRDQRDIHLDQELKIQLEKAELNAKVTKINFMQ